MGLRKCPKCELNYIKDDEKLCNVCRRTARRERDDGDEQESLCIECGEHPAMKGRDICALCYKEMLRQEQLQNQRKSAITALDLDSVDLKEVDVPLSDDIPAEEIADISDELDDEFVDPDPDGLMENHDGGEEDINFDENVISIETLDDEDDGDESDDDAGFDGEIAPVRRIHR